MSKKKYTDDERRLIREVKRKTSNGIDVQAISFTGFSARRRLAALVKEFFMKEKK